MHELLSFIGEHPVTSVAIAAFAAVVTLIVVSGICAAWSEYLDHKYGELR